MEFRLHTDQGDSARLFSIFLNNQIGLVFFINYTRICAKKNIFIKDIFPKNQYQFFFKKSA